MYMIFYHKYVSEYGYGEFGDDFLEYFDDIPRTDLLFNTRVEAKWYIKEQGFECYTELGEYFFVKRIPIFHKKVLTSK